MRDFISNYSAFEYFFTILYYLLLRILWLQTWRFLRAYIPVMYSIYKTTTTPQQQQPQQTNLYNLPTFHDLKIGIVCFFKRTNCIAIDDLYKSLCIYTSRFPYTHASNVFLFQ